MLHDLLKAQIPTLTVQSLALGKAAFADQAAAAKWITDQGFAAGKVETAGASYVFEQRDKSAFRPGSLRTISGVGEGVAATVGIPVIEKSLAKAGTPEFALSELKSLEDIQVVEITLTRAPALGSPAEFSVLKSMTAPPAGAAALAKPIAILKTDDEQRKVYGYALVPDLPDLQGDVVSAADIAKAADSFLKNLSAGTHKGDGVGEEHQVFKGVGYPCCSFIDEVGAFGVKGGWWIGVKVEHDNVWKAIKAGEIKGFSIGGTGKRTPLPAPALKTLGGRLLALEIDKSLTLAQAAAFAREHGYRAEEPEQLEKAWRFRQEAGELAGATVVELTPAVKALVAAAPIAKAIEDLELDELRHRIRQALKALHPHNFPWLRAVFTNRVIYDLEMDTFTLYQRPYTVDGDTVTLGDAVQVTVQYVAAEVTKSAELLHDAGPRPAGAPSVRKTLSQWLAGLFKNRPAAASTSPVPPQEIEMTPQELKAVLAEHDQALLKTIQEQIAKQLPTPTAATPPTVPAPPPLAPVAPLAPVIEMANKAKAAAAPEAERDAASKTFGVSDGDKALAFLLGECITRQDKLAGAFSELAGVLKSRQPAAPLGGLLDLTTAQMPPLAPKAPAAAPTVTKAIEAPVYDPVYGYGPHRR